MRLKNKVAIITGAGSGIEKETVFLIAKEGARFVLTGRTAGKLENVCRKICENGGKAIFKTGDVSRSPEEKIWMMLSMSILQALSIVRRLWLI